MPKTVYVTRTIPTQKIQTIKAIRLASRLYADPVLGLADAKHLVDAVIETGRAQSLYTGADDVCGAVVAVLASAGVASEAREPTVTVTLLMSEFTNLRALAWGAAWDRPTHDRLGDEIDRAIDDAYRG